MPRWLQIQGDPSVRRFLFEQERVRNDCDERIDEVLGRVARLMDKRGVFHVHIAFSRCRLMLWHLSDPFRYQVHPKDEVLGDGLCAAYPETAYPRAALVPPRAISEVLEAFKRLRFQDPHLYLRSASLNLINGYVGLTFSCDGSHCLNYAEFLARAGETY